ncbi:hypothetical protein [Mesobacillus boroniphilus]|uniref:Uncharacterized protein n=1 Tax=Mesobacillus boroniphilus JCM 21738 TaxID=1294265 RepID=W4RMJ4_9BACI|nr:hypothetical protein [Mesobacillus boroniphilus]GAE44814.1 hypothetical protein JCM21738_1559 [Mesobacillus boroniphilus JCM 21738]
MKRYSLLLFLITSLVLSACTSDEPDEEVVAEQPAKEVVKNEETKQSKFEHLKNISLEVTEESLMALKPESMMGDLSYEKDIEDIGFNTPELDPELKNMLPAKLEELSSQTDDLETIKKDLVSLLASPHYKEIIENASAYEPHFEVAEKYPLELWTVGRKEAHRIIDAAAIMSENGWINDEQYSELRDWGFERSEA